MLIARKMTLLICSLAVFSNAASADDKVLTLETGKYTLHLNVPGLPKDKQDTRLPAEIKCDGNRIEMNTTGMGGNAIKLMGVQANGKVKLYVSEIERDSIITLHFVGKATSPSSAEGSIVFFKDGKKVAEGTWSISEAKDAKSDD